MNLYRNTGNAMLAIGVFSLIESAFSIMISSMQGALLGGTLDASQIQSMQNTFLWRGAIAAVNLALMVWLVYNSYLLGEELDVGSFKFGAIILILGELLLVALTFMIFPQLASIAEQLGSGGTVSEETLLNLLRLLSLILLAGLITLIGYIVYGIGVRKVGEILGSDNIKNGGLLIILGFIPFLAPIGFLLAGYSLREFS